MKPQPEPGWMDQLDGEKGWWATDLACRELSDWWDRRRRWLDGQDRHVPAAVLPPLESFRKCRRGTA